MGKYESSKTSVGVGMQSKGDFLIPYSVVKNCRRRTGNFILGESIEVARKMGAKKVIVTSVVANEIESAYSKFGFVKCKDNTYSCNDYELKCDRLK